MSGVIDLTEEIWQSSLVPSPGEDPAGWWLSLNQAGAPGTSNPCYLDLRLPTLKTLRNVSVVHDSASRNQPKGFADTVVHFLHADILHLAHLLAYAKPISQSTT